MRIGPHGQCPGISAELPTKEARMTNDNVRYLTPVKPPAFDPVLAARTWRDDFLGAVERDGLTPLTNDEIGLAMRMARAGCTVTQAVAVIHSYRAPIEREPLDDRTHVTTLQTHARIKALTPGVYKVFWDGREFAEMHQSDLVEYLHRINQPERVTYRRLTPVVGPDRR
jgi:hypothetical protein